MPIVGFGVFEIPAENLEVYRQKWWYAFFALLFVLLKKIIKYTSVHLINKMLE